MQLTTTPEQDAIFAAEAVLRNQTVTVNEPLYTAESIALLLIDKSVRGYAATHMTAARAAMTPVADALIAASPEIRNKILLSAVTELKKQGLM